ncbi:hypothetical protein ARSEF4850_005777 [Beauveria asiatica]
MTVPVVTAPHPLAELSQLEFIKARDAIVKIQAADKPLFFRTIYLQEPAKAELLPFLEAEHTGRLTDATPRPIRTAFVEYDVLAANAQVFHRAVVDVVTGRVISNDEIPRKNHGFPHYNVNEFALFEEYCIKSEMVKEALKEYTVPEGFEYCIDPWPYGGPDEDDGVLKIMQGLVFVRDARKNNPDTNHYAYPIPLIPVMDWSTKEIIRIDRLPTGGSEDGMGPSIASKEPRDIFTKSVPAEYIPELLDVPARSDLKPLDVVQPEGASFKMHSDKLIEWQKWRFRLSITPREGPVLHDICYDGRSVLYRLSYSELTVPYGDPRAPFHRKHAFDFGDCGIGRAANSLKLGCDCLGAIHYVDAYFPAADGTPTKLDSVVCLHEQDSGILWKHTNYRTDRGVVARMREFVVQFIGTLINYEYILAFKFDQAGGITVETRATGMVSVVGIEDGKTSKYGNVVSPGILAQNHQHIFAVRIDPAIDIFGSENSGQTQTQVVVEESHPHKMNPETNPYGNYYEVRRTPVERATWIDSEVRLNRTIKLENPTKKNPISSKNVGYRLISPATQMLLADTNSRVAQRARFAEHNLWVTGHRDGEFWAAGEFTNQSTYEEGGVSDMVKRGDMFAVEGAQTAGETSDAVVWSVFGFTHNPRVEDWPVMPVEIHQLHLRPSDFFAANPALDVPTKRNDASVLVACCGGDEAN